MEGRFTADQKRVYEAVYAANRAVQSAMKPGVSWLEMHRLAERTLLEGLIAADLLVGPIEALVNLQIASLFMV